MMSKVNSFWILLVLAFVVACGGSAQPAPSSATTPVVVAQETPRVTDSDASQAAPLPAPSETLPLPAAAPTDTPSPTVTPSRTPTPTPTPLHPLTIASMRALDYPGSEIVIEQTLTPGSNYNRYIASYLSEGLKIYALLTIPKSPEPEDGFPAIIFNHGYIPPTQYRTTERYVAYVDAFARNGYVVFRPDYRGHGNSEGVATGGYGSPAYTIDVLNALTSLRRLPQVDPARIGMWGHSMGGQITLRAMVVDRNIKAGVIWAGVVGSYQDLYERWRRRTTGGASVPSSGARRWREELVAQYGLPEENPAFWNSISPNSYLDELSGPLQLHHGTADTSVPVEFSERLAEQLKAAGQEYELYIYPGDNHNISVNLSTALARSVQFFDQYVKNAQFAQ